MIKCITLHQPWASAIALGYKTIETRSHQRFKSLVGQRIGIHAGVAVDHSFSREHLVGCGAAHWGNVAPMFLTIVPHATRNRGVVLATALVVGHRALDAHDNVDALTDCSDGDRFGLLLAGIELLWPPIPARGYQGAWNFEHPQLSSGGGVA